MGLFYSIVSTVLAMIMTVFGTFFAPLKPFEPKPEAPEVNTQLMTDFITNGSTPYVIVVSADAAETDITAAKVLQKYIADMSDVTLSIVTDSTVAVATELVVGSTNREPGDISIDRSALKSEGYIIKRFADKVFIAGAGERGTIYGAYAFLQDIFGCRWFTKNLIVTPESSVLQLPQTINIIRNSYFECRDTDWESPKNVEYSLANGLNSCIYRKIPTYQGGTVNYLSNFCHTLTTQFVKASQYFETHPEYFAYREDDAGRVDRQLCLTNPEVLRITTQEVLDILKNSYNPNSADVQIISLTQHDNQQYCQCEKCKALDEAEGSHSGTMISFVNQVADAVKAAGYDNVAIDTFAYQYTRTPPKTVKPRDNVIVRLCSIECCFSHTFEDPSCSENIHFMSDLKGWGEICDRIYIWDYTTNYSNYLGLFPDFGVIQRNMQTFYENGAKGIYEEGNYTAAQCNGEFDELRAYLLSRLMVDPYLDYDKTMNEFLKAYYGAGWQYMREFIDMMTKNTGNNGDHMGIYAPMTEKGVLSLKTNEVKYCDDLWANAKAKAGTDWQQKNVVRSELAWRYWKGCNKVSEFSRLNLPSEWQNANKTLYDDMVTFGIVRFNESGLLTKSPDFTKTPSSWRA